MAQPQSFRNHARFDPLVHFTTVPVLFLNLGLSIAYTVHHWPAHYRLALWWIVMSLTLIVMNVAARAAALRSQDRTIRLEEQLRLARLVSASELIELDSLTLPQYIALRFASNAELPDLARRAVRENLTRQQIKQSIVSWRADNHRV